MWTVLWIVVIGWGLIKGIRETDRKAVREEHGGLFNW